MRIAIVLAFFLFTPVLYAEEIPNSLKLALAQFEGLCLKNEDDFSRVGTIMSLTKSATQLKPECFASAGNGELSLVS